MSDPTPASIRFSRPGGQFLEITPDGCLRVRFGMAALRVRKVNLGDLRRVEQATDYTSGRDYVVLKDSSRNTARFPLSWFEKGYPEAARRLAAAVSGIPPHGDGVYATLTNDADASGGTQPPDTGSSIPTSADDPRATDFLTERLGRPPTVEELADFRRSMEERGHGHG